MNENGNKNKKASIIYIIKGDISLYLERGSKSSKMSPVDESRERVYRIFL